MLTRGGTNDCFRESSAEQNQVGLFEQLEWLEKRTSVAKAVKRRRFYGTAEAVPFVQRRSFIQLFWPLQRGSSLYRMCHRKS
jgi:hypothetical protein